MKAGVFFIKKPNATVIAIRDAISSDPMLTLVVMTTAGYNACYPRRMTNVHL